MTFRRLLIVLGALVFSFGGPCVPSGYFSSVVSSAGVSVISAVLSDIINTVLPPVSSST